MFGDVSLDMYSKKRWSEYAREKKLKKQNIGNKEKVEASTKSSRSLESKCREEFRCSNGSPF